MFSAKLAGFLSDHTSPDPIVEISTEPDVIHLEEGREANLLNFDFVIRGLTDRDLTLRFIKVAVYDEGSRLLTYRYLNHNAVGVAGIHTLGKYTAQGREQFDLFNPFYRFPKSMPIHYLRYMFTFADSESGEEYYYGDIVVAPVRYQQQVRLHVPLKGFMTILDGHDYYSHHRRFGMTLVRQVTGGQFASNFSRYALDFVLIGPDGCLSEMTPEEYARNYDFHFDDARSYYTNEAPVLAPAAGQVVAAVDTLDDLYASRFDLDAAIQERRVADLAGNYVTIRHNTGEYSHLFHLLRGSVRVAVGESVNSGDVVGRVGFSGAATTYSHLHYQLMDGPDFLNDNPLPCQFSDLTLLVDGQVRLFPRVALDTSDFVISE